jgi:energy-coupling factor transporter ATP-binding protein EcfA2
VALGRHRFPVAGIGGDSMSRKSSELLLSALGEKRLLAIDGPNFSGRSDLLRRFCGTHTDGRMYLGPEVYFALSGLTTTVRQELELHAGARLESCDGFEFAESLGLTKLLEQHPATLSGGEQTCLAVLCAMILKPKILAADCALEQLDSHKLATCLELLKAESGPVQGAVVTDNRLDEWDYAMPTVEISALAPDPSRFPPVAPLDPSCIDRLKVIAAPTIELQNLIAGYAEQSHVLFGVNLTLQRGRVYKLRGPNGSGKSTLAKVLSGVLPPINGEIRVNGNRVSLWKTPGIIAGYHLQNPDVGLFESSVSAELGLKSGSNIPTDASTIRDAFGLQPYSGKNPLSLPFPVRKRVSLAATVARRPPWIILDEPTLGSDSATIVALAEIVQALANKGHGVIVISHSIKFLQALEGNQLEIRDGRVAVSPGVPRDTSELAAQQESNQADQLFGGEAERQTGS